MNLDKHDLFRNAVPGFIFALVIFSFYAAAGRLETIRENQKAIVVFAAGFPLGFVIHVIYRIIFHVRLGEQGRMEKEDAKAIRGLPAIKSEFKNKTEQELSHILHFVLLNGPQNKAWKSRIDFQFSSIHAFGASCLSIAFALLFMLIFKSKEKVIHEHLCMAFFVTFIWICIGVVFYKGRGPVKSSIVLDRKIFVEENSKSFI